MRTSSLRWAMVNSGEHLGVPLQPPVNTHVAYAFLLNCRKFADFFSTGSGDDINGVHFLQGTVVTFNVKTCTSWKKCIHKQLAHITGTRGPRGKELTAA